jgi:hypothetical protein
MGLFFEPSPESACPLEGRLVVVDPKEQKKTVARLSVVRTHQGRMIMRCPLVKAEQDGSLSIQDLAKVIMFWLRLGLAEKRLVPSEAGGNVPYADDRPNAFHVFAVIIEQELDERGPDDLPATAAR